MHIIKGEDRKWTTENWIGTTAIDKAIGGGGAGCGGGGWIMNYSSKGWGCKKQRSA